MPCRVLRDVVDHWRDRFDWRAAERRLNGLPQFQIEIDGRVVHYVHVRGVDRESAALVLTHGWPGSFVEMYKIIPMLTDPASNGLPGYRSFDVIVPSLSHHLEVPTFGSAISSRWRGRTFPSVRHPEPARRVRTRRSPVIVGVQRSCELGRTSCEIDLVRHVASCPPVAAAGAR
jgi:hypothetical protein